MQTTEQERFMKHVDIDTATGCWMWTGHTRRSNLEYGRFYLAATKKLVTAHRYMYEVMHGGPIPQGLESDHLCRKTLCVNPFHLEAVTRRENNRRRDLVPGCKSPGVVNRHKTHCVAGHKFTARNTYITPKGERQCKQCTNKRTKVWAAQNREYHRAYDKKRYAARKAALVNG